MSSLFIVDQTEQALVLQFGQPLRVIRTPGLWVKKPFIQNVILYDKRLLDFEPPPEEVIGADQKRLIVETYARYRITNPLLFYQTVASELIVRARLGALVSGSLRQVIGNVTLSALLSPERATIMRRSATRSPARRSPSASMSSMSAFAVPICRRRTARRSLPACAPSASSRRPSTAARCPGGEDRPRQRRPRTDSHPRRRPARRAEGAWRRRCQGDRDYAKAYDQDKDFFAFYRSLQAYRDALEGHDTLFVLTPQSNFFRFFNNLDGAPATRRPPRPAAAGAGESRSEVSRSAGSAGARRAMAARAAPSAMNDLGPRWPLSW